jgi:hypothetical protein
MAPAWLDVKEEYQISRVTPTQERGRHV